MLAGQSQILSLRSFMTYYGLKHLVTFRIHIEEINHTVLLHMTEKMGYKHSEVLSAVLTNRACHTLTVYFLLNNKMKRISKEYRVSWRKQSHQHVLHIIILFLSPGFNILWSSQEKLNKKDMDRNSELFQTRWRKHVEKITIPPKQTPAYLAVSKGPTKEKKHRNGESLKLVYRHSTT